MQPKRQAPDHLGHLTFDEAEGLATNAFMRAGVRETEAIAAGRILTLAEAMGIPTHGLNRVADYIRRLDAGGIVRDAEIFVHAPAPALCHVNGHNGLGPAVAHRALNEAMSAARNVGLGAAFIRGGSHLGALAPYLFIAAEAGFAGVMTSNTAPMIAPAGGKSPRIGNNPVGLAIPHPDGQHVLLDMALTMVSRSRVRAAAKDGVPIPDTWATDAQGLPTTDATRAMQGLMCAIGGDKGASLALCLDLLAGGLSGAAMSAEIPAAVDHPERSQNLGQMFILIDAKLLLSDEERRNRMEDAEKMILNTPAIDEGSPIRLPGARALQSLKRVRENGLEVEPTLLSKLSLLAEH